MQMKKFDLVPIFTSLVSISLALLLSACGGGGGGDNGNGGNTNTRTPETIVFTLQQDVNGIDELYAVEDDGSGLRKLSGPMLSTSAIPMFKRSPDGQKVAYIADQETDNKFELYVANIDGSGWLKVSQALGANADVFSGNTYDAFWWSPDSTRLVYLADADIDNIRELYLVNADGTDHHRINGTVGSTPVVQIGQAEWSQDGRYVAYYVRTLNPYYSGFAVDRIGINTHDTTIGGRNSVAVSGRLAANQPYWINGFVWSPDSTRIAYTSYEHGTQRELYIAIAGQTAQQTRVNVPLAANQGVLFRNYWSGDSRYLLYAITGTTPGGLYTHDTQDLTARNGKKISGNLVAGGGINWFAWAPDFSRVAYTADQDTNDQTELYSALPDVADSAVMLAGMPTFGDVGHFVWSPDSSRVAYIADQDTDNVQEAYSVAAAGGSTTVKISQTIAGNNDVVRDMLAWSPDSQHVAYEVRGDQAGLYVTRPDGNSTAHKVSGDTYIAQSRFHYQPSIDQYFTNSAWTSDSRYFIFAASVDPTYPSPRLPYRLYTAAMDANAPAEPAGSIAINDGVGVRSLDY